MARQITVGIDIGTSQVKAIIAEGAFEQGRFSPRIIGAATAESKGLERGYIVSAEEAAEMAREARSRAVVHQIAFTFRYTYCLQEMRRRILAGEFEEGDTALVDFVDGAYEFGKKEGTRRREKAAARAG